MKTMRYVAKTCASAKVAILYIKHLGHEVTGVFARGAWRRQRDKLPSYPEKVPIKGDIGQSVVRFEIDAAWGTEEFKQLAATDNSEGSQIVIEYEETEESIKAEYDAEMERVEAEIDGDGEPVDPTDPGGIDAATQAVGAAQDGAKASDRKVTPTDNDDGYP